MLLSEAYTLFITERRYAAVTPATLAFYQDSVGQMITRHGARDVTQLQGAVDEHFGELVTRGLRQASLHTYWRGIKTFSRWCVESEYCTPIKLPPIKPPQTTIRPMSREQVGQVLKALGEDFEGKRNRALLHLLWDVGLRVSEACGIQVQDVEWEKRWVLITGKGGKERWVPFGLKSRQHLWTYYKQRAKYASAGQKALFISRRDKPITRRAIQMVFRHLQARLSFPGIRLSAHTLRHSFAVAYVEAGGDPYSLQAILGHSDQEMTSRYVTLSRSNLKEQHQHFGPGDS